MPANLSPEYKAAEAAFRKARDPRERLEGLREMLRTIPKHKGTEHMQSDIKARIKNLSEEIEGGKRGGGGGHGGPSLVIRPEGAAQVALVGPPNSGKSTLHARLTGSAAHAAPYPFTTQHPEPGMLQHQDVHFQLIDLPAFSPEHPVPWLCDTLQTADAALLVMDLGDAGCVEQLEGVHAVLQRRAMTLTDRWDAEEIAGGEGDPFARQLPTLMLANKADAIPGLDAELQTFVELTGLRYPVMKVSAATGQGLGELAPWLFERLGVVRIYTKAPGKPPDKSRPFTLRRGQTIADVARLVHKDLERSMKYARVWGHSDFEGQHVGPEHVVGDGDVVELHA